MTSRLIDEHALLVAMETLNLIYLEAESLHKMIDTVAPGTNIAKSFLDILEGLIDTRAVLLEGLELCKPSVTKDIH